MRSSLGRGKRPGSLRIVMIRRVKNQTTLVHASDEKVVRKDLHCSISMRSIQMQPPMCACQFGCGHTRCMSVWTYQMYVRLSGKPISMDKNDRASWVGNRPQK